MLVSVTCRGEIGVAGAGPRGRPPGPGEGLCVRTCPARVSAPVPARGAPRGRPAGGPEVLKVKLFELCLLPPRNLPAGRIPGPGAEMKIVSLGISVKCQTGCPLGRAAPGEISHGAKSGRSPFNLRDGPKVS